MLNVYSNTKENIVHWNILAHMLLRVCGVKLVFSPNLLVVLKLCDCHKFLGCVMMGVDQIFFCIFTPLITLKMGAFFSSKMFDHTYCILNGVRTQKTIIYIISVQDHIIAYWVSCTRGAFDTERVNRSGDACDLCWDTAVLTGLLWFSSFLWDNTI